SSKLTIDDATFVIGGQATNLWAWFYQDRAPELSSSSELTSKYIDYFGTKKAAESLRGAWWEGLSSKCRRYEYAKHGSSRGRGQRKEVADRLHARRSWSHKTRVGKRRFDRSPRGRFGRKAAPGRRCCHASSPLPQESSREYATA